MTDARNPLLEVEDVVLRFGGVTALDGVTFDVRQSELFAIIGPNGAGKTSIFNCLNSVYRPTTGHIRFDGRRPRRRVARRHRQVGHRRARSRTWACS